MTVFSLQWRLKLLLNSEGSVLSKNPHHSKLGLLGFNDSCSVYPLHFNSDSVSKNGFVNKWRILASSRSNSTKSSNQNANAESGLGLNDDFDDFDDDDDDDDGEDDLSCFRGLVLDISYRPVNVVCWKRAICLEFMEKADVLEYYDQTVNSPSGSFNIPAVLRVCDEGDVRHLLQVMKRKRVRNSLSRKNIFFRDEYTCQYCSATTNLTIDHVLPMSRGGKWEWENLVTACAKCNCKKGQKTPEEVNMNLFKVPKAPKEYDILAIPLTSAAVKMLKIRKGTPQEWNQYLP